MESKKKKNTSKQEFNKIKKERDRKLREEYKAAKKAGGDTTRRLHFLDQILKTLGYSYNELAERSGYSSQLIGWWMIADNCKYKHLIKVLQSINIGIEPKFEDKEASTEIIKEERYELRGTLPSLPKKTAKEDIGSIILNKRLEEGGDLLFLAQFIKESGLTLSAFCKKIKTDYTCFRRWISTDDIPISKLYEIADAFDKKIIWNIRDLTKEA